MNRATRIDRIFALVDRHRGAALGMTVVALWGLAWANRFVQDDAFISFRYAQNLVDGNGLVWNVGERVEGYTNFLWVLLMVPPIALGIDPVAYSLALGLVLFPVSLLLTARIAELATGSWWAALMAVVLLGTSYTFSAYATGGLETQLHAAVLLGVTHLALRSAQDGSLSPRDALSLSLLAATAIMTRMDSVIHLTLVYGYLAHELNAGRRLERGALARAALLALVPGASLVALWLAWKLHYYGDILPNTYYAKMDPISNTWRVGVRFLRIFVETYWLAPILLLPIVFARIAARSWRRPLGLLAALVVAGLAYVVRIGGDFMEFRILVPLLPSFFVLIAWLFVCVVPWRILSVAAAVLVVASSLHHARTFWFAEMIESVPLLQAHIDEPPYEWALTGQVLGELFRDADEPPRIAVIAAGAVPFYSGLPSLDMMGLNDAWVARHGLTDDPELTSPGHNRLASFDYLVERDVNLVLGIPWIAERKPGLPPRFGTAGLVRFGAPTPTEEQIPEDARMQVLEINLNDTHRLYVLYLMGHEKVDAVIRDQRLRMHPVNIRRDRPADRSQARRRDRGQ